MSDGTEDGVDREIRALLGALDPGRTDPGYWLRFQRWVVNSAGPELARRRRAATATVSGVVLSWWRTLVPTAVVTAAVAGFVLLRDPASAPVADLSVEEQVLEGIEAPVMPAFETTDLEGGIVVVNEVY